MLVGALHSLPGGLREVAVEAGIPRAVSAKVRPAIGQVRRWSSHRSGPSALPGFAGREKRPGIFGERRVRWRGRRRWAKPEASASHATPASLAAVERLTSVQPPRRAPLRNRFAPHALCAGSSAGKGVFTWSSFRHPVSQFWTSVSKLMADRRGAPFDQRLLFVGANYLCISACVCR